MSGLRKFFIVALTVLLVVTQSSGMAFAEEYFGEDPSLGVEATRDDMGVSDEEEEALEQDVSSEQSDEAQESSVLPEEESGVDSQESKDEQEENAPSEENPESEEELPILISKELSSSLLNAEVKPQAGVVGSGSAGPSISWVLYDDGLLEIAGSGNMYNWTTKSTELPPWNAHKAIITEVVIKEGITSIGNYAFYGYGSIEKVTLPNSLSVIGASSFVNTHALSFFGLASSDPDTTVIELPDGLTEIGEQALYNSRINYGGDIAFSLPASLTTIGSSAFKFGAVTGCGNATITVNGNYSSNFDGAAFDFSTYLKNTIVIKNETEYNKFKKAATAAKTKAAFTYPVEIGFYDSPTATDPAFTMEKLPGFSIFYSKDDSTGAWYYNENYKLPDPTEIAGPGYTANWVTYSGVTPVAVTKNTIVTASTKVYLDKTINNPTVTGTLEKIYYIDGVPDGRSQVFYIDVPDNRMEKDPYPLVGINVEHPLLKGDGTDGHYGNETDGYVYFTYGWIDIEVLYLGNNLWGPTDGRRSGDYPFQYSGSGLVSDDFITIEDSDDLRKSGDNRYEVIVVGYYVKDGSTSKFYQSRATDMYFGSAPSSDITDDKIYTLYTNKKKATITFNLNGGAIDGDSGAVEWYRLYDAGESGYEKLKNYPDFPNSLPAPTKGTEVLTGWKNVATGKIIPLADMGEELILAGTVVNGKMLWDQVFIAVWETELSVTYKYTLDGGTNWINYGTPESVLPNSKLVRPEDPSLVGYASFDGWYKKSDLTGPWDYGNDTVDKTLVLYGEMEPITYQITYALNGGTVATANPTSYTVADLDITLNTPTRAGYIFTGWTAALTPPSAGNVTFEDGVIKKGTHGNLTITANFSPAPVTIEYYPNYGTNIKYTGFYNETDATSGKYDEFVTRPVMTDTQVNPTREGYEFKGWRARNESTNNWQFKNDGSPTPLTTANHLVADSNTPPQSYILTLDAQWEKKSYKLTFDSKGSDQASTIDDLELEVGYDEVIVNRLGFPVDPTKGSSGFLGWMLPNGDMLDALTKMPAEDVKLVALWEGELEVTYKYTLDQAPSGSSSWTTHSGYSNESEAGFAFPNTKLVRAADPFADGYIFSGWYKDAACTDEWDYASDTIGDAPITLYGKMVSVEYVIIYNMNGGVATPANPLTYKTTDLDITLNEPRKEGYLFTGWTAALTQGILVFEDTKIKQGTYGNLTLTANFKPTPVIITYYEGYGANAAYTGFQNELTATKGEYNGEVERFILSNTQLNPSRDGYTFAGWKAKNASKTWSFTGEGSPTTLTLANGLKAVGNPTTSYKLELYAQWTKNSHKVTFDSKGANQASSLDSLVLTVGYGETIVEKSDPAFPGDPTKGGYVFKGWQMPDGTMLKNTTKMPDKDILLTAIWETDGTESSISANDFSYNYDWGAFDKDTTRVLAQAIVYDAQGNPTTEVAQISDDDIARLNAAREGLDYGQTTKVTVTFFSAAGKKADVVVTIYRGEAPPAPEPPKPDPDPEPTPEPEPTPTPTPTPIPTPTPVPVPVVPVVPDPEPTPDPTPDPQTDPAEEEDAEKDAEKDDSKTPTIVKPDNTDSPDSGAGTNTGGNERPADAGLVYVDESGMVHTTIFGADVPLGEFGTRDHWSIVSLVLTILGVIIALVHLVFGVRRRKNKEEEATDHKDADIDINSPAYLSAIDVRNKQEDDKKKKRHWTAMRVAAIIVGVLAPVCLLLLEDYTLPPAWFNYYTPVFIVFFIAVVACTVVHAVVIRMKKDEEEPSETPKDPAYMSPSVANAQ